MLLRSTRRLMHNRPLVTTTLMVLLAVVMVIGSLVGVLVAAHRGGGPTAYGPVDTTGCATDPARPKRQLRAMWITTIGNSDWPSKSGLDEATVKAEYVALMDLAKARGLNAVVVMVRVAGDTFWPSKYEPWTQYLTGTRGKDPGWDPMAFAVAEAHRRDLEFHAWFNPYRGSTIGPSGAGGDLAKLAEGHPLRKHPEWAVVYPAAGDASQIYFNPGIPEARRFVEDAMLDVVARYDVDAVHFDDFFYPYPAAGEEFGDAAAFEAHGKGQTDRAAWRRANVDLLIKEMYERTHQLKPWVRFGVSPFGIWRNASQDPAGSATAGNQSYTANHADTRKWVQQGWLDYIVPQLYWAIGFTIADYAVLVDWWSKLVKGTSVQLYIGQAAYRIGNSGAWSNQGELPAHLDMNRRYPEITGDVFFTARNLREDKLGAISQVVAQHYTRPALVPQLGEATAATATPPEFTEARADRATGAVTLRWMPPFNLRRGSDQVRAYVVYRFDGAGERGDGRVDRCGFADARSVLTITRDQEFVDRSAKPGQQYTYFVTVVDRQVRESDPASPRVVGPARSPSAGAPDASSGASGGTGAGPSATR